MTDESEKEKVEEKAAEEKTSEETEEPAADSSAGNEKVQNVKSPLDQADDQIKEMKKLNEEKKELLDREEKVIAENRLMGRSTAGVVEKPKEKTPEEFSDGLLDGSEKITLEDFRAASKR